MITLISMTIQLAITELRRNKMRSMLTMLGVIIGVGAVIAMISIGQGASSTVQTLTVEDAKAIEKQASAVKTVTFAKRGISQLIYGGQNWSTETFGVTPEYVVVRDWPL